MTIEERLARIGELKDALDAAETAKTNAKIELDRFTAETIEYMRTGEHAIGGTRVNGDLYVPKTTTFGNVHDEDAFLAWLEETEQEDDFLAERKPVRARLSELVRDLQKRGVPEDQWPPGLGYYTKDYIARTKGKN